MIKLKPHPEQYHSILGLIGGDLSNKATWENIELLKPHGMKAVRDFRNLQTRKQCLGLKIFL